MSMTPWPFAAASGRSGESRLNSVLTLDRLITLVQGVAALPELWRPGVHFGSHERWATHLHRDDAVDIWVMTWQPLTGVEAHDHGASVEVFTVVEGSLEEHRPARNSEELVTSLSPSVVRPVAAGVRHELRNASSLPAISIHAASPPDAASPHEFGPSEFIAAGARSRSA
jgi:mannose-6-phosphate isomerase-like protein (cupin superfamily)